MAGIFARVSITLAAVLSASLVPASAVWAETGDNAEHLMLRGGIEIDDTGPRVDDFARDVVLDPHLPCTLKSALPRLLRVARDEEMRRRVWKRMLSQELYWLGRHEQELVQRYATACEMPL